MELKKHYEPTALAEWQKRVGYKTTSIVIGVRAAGLDWSEHRCRQEALADKDIEEARQRIPVTHVEVVHTGKSEDQVWSSKQVAEWVEHGWATLADDTITLRTAEHQPDLVYTITRSPGYYCANSGERIPLSDLALSQFMTKTVATIAPREAAAWLVAHGKQADDYTATRNYHCVLRADLHAQFSVKATVA